MSFTEARNAKCSLFDENKWAKEYRSTESDLQAYRDRERLIEMLYAAPSPWYSNDQERKKFDAEYRKWFIGVKEFLDTTGNPSYRHYGEHLFSENE